MSRHCFDLRVLGPLVFAGACFATRMFPAAALPPSPPPRAVELPAPIALPAPKGDVAYVLDATKSTVRFLVEGDDGELLAACTQVSGRVRLGAQPETSELELDLDLGALDTVGGAPSTIDLHRLLGVHLGARIHYHATLVRTSTTPVPGVVERVWLGVLHLDQRTIRQPMQLWQCSLPGQPMRMQGHGTVDVADYGLPRRGWFGMFQEKHVVTLGLDLAWRRDGAR